LEIKSPASPQSVSKREGTGSLPGRLYFINTLIFKMEIIQKYFIDFQKY